MPAGHIRESREVARTSLSQGSMRRETPPTVLLVDDEPLFISSLQDALARRTELRVMTAADGRRAVEILRRETVDLLVSDLRMPEMGGAELLSALQEIDFNGRILIVSAYLTPEAERVVRQLGALACLEKPVDLETLVDLVEDLLEHPPSSFDGLSLAGFVQLLQMEAKSCLLRVRSGDLTGDLTFRRGELVDAAWETLVGEEAALEILGWGEVRFEFHPLDLDGPEGPARVQGKLQHLLLEAARRRDEEALAGDPPHRSNRPIPTTHKETLNMANAKESLNQILDVDGAIGAALVDYESGMTLGHAGGGDVMDMEVAAAGNTEVVQAKMRVMNSLDLGDEMIEDMLITLTHQYHVIRPLTKAPNLFLYAAFDRKKANLAMARHKLADIEKNLEL